MWPFSPRLVTVDGKTMTRKAHRAAEKIRLAEAKKLSALRIERRSLDVKKEIDAYTEGQAEHAQEKKRNRWRDWWTRRAEGGRALARAIAGNLPLASALIAVVLCGIAEIAGQWMFYGNLTWPAGSDWLATILPFVLPAISWHYALSARWRAANGLPHAAKTRRMWMATIIAAGLNTYNGVSILHNLDAGVLLGLVSIAGPAVWHAVVIDTKDRASGLDVTQIITTLSNRLHHPILSWRANELWSASKGRVTPDMAWLMVYRRAKGHFPGQQPTAQILTHRNQWLFRIVFGRVLNPLIVVAAEAPRQRADTPPPAALTGRTQRADHTPPLTADQHADQTADSPLVSDDNGPASVPTSALTGGRPAADADTFDADFAAWQAELNQHADHPVLSAHSPSSGPEFDSRSAPADTGDQREEVSADQRKPGDTGQRQPSGPRGARSARRSARRAARISGGKRDFTQPVTDYYNQRIASGAKPEDITGKDAAEATGAAESTARNILSDLKRGTAK